MMVSAACVLLLVAVPKFPVNSAVEGVNEAVTVQKFPPRDQSLSGIAEWIPTSMLGYRSTEEAIYTRDTVYDYLDGGAEIYLTYDFQAVLGRRYVHANGSEIFFDMFDMGSGPEAFGIFSQVREGAPSNVGQGSEYTPGMLHFWKNRFYVSITATDLSRNTTNAVMKLGRVTEGLIASVGREPELLGILPPRGLKQDRVRFLHSFMALRHHYNLGWKDILRFDGKVDAVLGEYSSQPGESVLLVVKYPDERAVRKGAEGYLGYMKEKKGVKTYPTQTGEVGILSWDEAAGEERSEREERRWSSVVRSGPLLVIVLQAPEREEAERLAQEVLRRQEGRKR